jgi:hypothetical protein
MRMAIAIGAALLASGAMAAEGSGKKASSKPDLDKMVCKSVSLSGSRLDSKRVCMTKLQWDEARQRDRDIINRAQTTQLNKM